jgi:hypothetical protein
VLHQTQSRRQIEVHRTFCNLNPGKFAPCNYEFILSFLHWLNVIGLMHVSAAGTVPAKKVCELDSICNGNGSGLKNKPCYSATEKSYENT